MGEALGWGALAASSLIVGALLALARHERLALGAAARRAAVERWSWGSVAERLLEPFVS